MASGTSLTWTSEVSKTADVFPERIVQFNGPSRVSRGTTPGPQFYVNPKGLSLSTGIRTRLAGFH